MPLSSGVVGSRYGYPDSSNNGDQNENHAVIPFRRHPHSKARHHEHESRDAADRAERACDHCPNVLPQGRRNDEEVGKEFGVTRERIRQIEAKALEKIRTHENARRLKSY